MSDSVNYALANLLLTATSIWAFIVCRDLLFASAAFIMYALVGVLGVAHYIFSNNVNVNKMLNNAYRWAQPLYLPLLAVDALLTTGLELQFALVVLVCPIFYLVMTELLHKHVRSDLLDLSAVLSALAVCYAAYTAQDVVGGVFALLGLAAFMGTGFKSHSTLEHLLLVSVVDLAAVQFFKHVFSF